MRDIRIKDDAVALVLTKRQAEELEDYVSAIVGSVGDHSLLQKIYKKLLIAMDWSTVK